MTVEKKGHISLSPSPYPPGVERGGGGGKSDKKERPRRKGEKDGGFISFFFRLLRERGNVLSVAGATIHPFKKKLGVGVGGGPSLPLFFKSIGGISSKYFSRNRVSQAHFPPPPLFRSYKRVLLLPCHNFLFFFPPSSYFPHIYYYAGVEKTLGELRIPTTLGFPHALAKK